MQCGRVALLWLGLAGGAELPGTQMCHGFILEGWIWRQAEHGEPEKLQYKDSFLLPPNLQRKAEFPWSLLSPGIIRSPGNPGAQLDLLEEAAGVGTVPQLCPCPCCPQVPLRLGAPTIHCQVHQEHNVCSGSCQTNRVGAGVIQHEPCDVHGAAQPRHFAPHIATAVSLGAAARVVA